MNLEELQIKVSIELKDLEKQLKSITKSIDKTLGPQTTKRLMQNTHRVIKNESIAINKTLNKAFEVDYKKFNTNLNAAMNQAKLTVRSACNDIRRELNAALNVKANIRVTGKTSIDGSVTGSSGSTTTASSMASSQYIGAMIIKATNAIIKNDNSNTSRLENTINKSTKEIVKAIKNIKIDSKPTHISSNNNEDVVRAINSSTRDIIAAINNINTQDKKTNQKSTTAKKRTAAQREEQKQLTNSRDGQKALTTSGINFDLKEAGRQISLITKEMKDAVKVINILKRNFSNLSNSLNTKMLGTGSYGNNLPQTEHINFTLGKEGELFIGTIERMKAEFKSLKLLTTSGINFELGDTIEQLVDIIELMKKIHSLRKGLYSDSRGFEMGDSTSEYHTGSVKNVPKGKEGLKEIGYKEPIVVDEFKVIDDELVAQINEAISKIKKVSLPTDVFNFDTDEIIAKVRESNEAIKQAFKDVQNLRKQSNMPLLEAPIEEAKVDMELFKEIVAQAIGIIMDLKALEEYFNSDSMDIDKAAKDALKLSEALIDIEEAAKKLDGYDLEGLQLSDGVTDELKPFVNTLERAWILIGKISRYNPKPIAPAGIPMDLEEHDVDDLLNPPRPRKPESLNNLPITNEQDVNDLLFPSEVDIPVSIDVSEAKERIDKITKQIKEDMADLVNVGSDLNKSGSYVTNKGNKLIGKTGTLKSNPNMMPPIEVPDEEVEITVDTDEAQKQLDSVNEKLEEVSINIEEVMEAMRLVKFPEFEIAYGSIDNLIKSVVESIKTLTSELEKLKEIKLTIDTSDTEKRLKNLLDISKTVRESLVTGDYIKEEPSKPDKKPQYPPKAPGQNKSKDTKDPKGKPPKPTVMGFGFGAYKNEIDMLVEYAKKAGSKIKEALFDKKGSKGIEKITFDSDELAMTIDDSFNDEIVSVLDSIHNCLKSISANVEAIKSIIAKDFAPQPGDSTPSQGSTFDQFKKAESDDEEALLEKRLLEDEAFFEESLKEVLSKKVQGKADYVLDQDPSKIFDIYKKSREMYITDKDSVNVDDLVELGKYIEELKNQVISDKLNKAFEIDPKNTINKAVQHEKNEQDINSYLDRMGFTREDFNELATVVGQELSKMAKTLKGEPIDSPEPTELEKVQKTYSNIEYAIDNIIDDMKAMNKVSDTVESELLSGFTLESVLSEIDKCVEKLKQMEKDSVNLDIDASVGIESTKQELLELSKIVSKLQEEFKETRFVIPDSDLDNYKRKIQSITKPKFNDSDEFAITVDDGDDDEDPFSEFRRKLEKAGENIIRFIEENAEEIGEQLEEVEEIINDNVPEIEPDFTLEGLFEFINDNMDAIIEAYENKLEEMQEVIDDADDFSEGVAQFIKDNLDKIIDAYEEKLNEIEEIVDDSADIIEESMENISDINLPILRSDALNEQFDAIRESIIKLEDSLDDIDDDREINISTEGIDESISAISKIKKALSVAFNPIDGPNKLDSVLTRIERKAISVFNKIKKVLSKVFSPIINAAKKIITPIARVFKNIVASARDMAYKIRDSIKLAMYKATALVRNYGFVIKTHLNKAFTGIKSTKLYTSIASALNKAKGAVSKFAAKVSPTLNKAFSKINVSKIASGIGKGIGKGLNGAKKALSKFASGCKSLWGKIKQIFSKGASDASKATGKLKTGLGNLLKQGLSFLSLYSLINLGKQAIEQSKMLAQAEVKLASLMKQRMGATNETISVIRQLAEEQAQLGVVSETAMKHGAQQLAMYVHSAQALKTLMPAIANLTARRGGVFATEDDAEEIATQLGEAIREGTTTPLEQSGIYLSEAEIQKFAALRTEEERAAYLANVIAKNVGNINEALANTPHGAIAQLKNNFQSLLGTLGIFLANVLKPIVQWLNTIVVACNNALKGLGKLLGFDMTGGAASVPDVGTGGGGGGSTPVDTTTPEIDTGGIDDAKDAYNDAKDAADEATEANEKFKGSLMGFDEINILSDNTQKSYESDSDSDPSDEYDPTDITPGTGGQLIPEVGELTEADSVFDKFSDKMKAFLDEVIEPFKNAWALLGDRWKAEWADLIESFKHFCDSLGKFLVSVWEHGGKEFVQHMAEIALAVGIAAMEIGGEILDSLARLWDHLDPAKNINTQGFLDALNEVSVKLRDFILGLGDHFESLMANGGQDVLNAMGDCFMNLGEAAVRGLGVAIDALDGLIDHLDPANNTITRDMLKSWEDAFHAIGNCALELANLLESVLANGGQEVINALGDAFVSFAGLVGDIVKEVSDAFAGLFKHLDPATNEFTKDFLKAWENAFKEISTMFGKMGDFLGSVMDNGGQELLNSIGDLGMKIGEAVGVVVEEFAKAFGELLDHLDPSKNSRTKNMLKSLDGLVDSVTKFVDACIKAFKKFMDSGGREFIKNLGDILVVIADLAATLAGGIIDLLTAFMDSFAGQALIEGVAKALEWVSEKILALEDVVNRIKDIFQDVIDIIVGILEGDGEKVGRAFANLIKNAFKLSQDIMDWLIDIGVDLILGLIEGLKKTPEIIWNGIKFIFDTIVGFFKELFGIHSPSTVFADLGVNLIEGLVEGIGSMVSAVWDAITLLADSILEAFQGIVDKLSEIWENIKESVSDAWNTIKDTVVEKCEEVYNNTSEKWEQIKETVSDKCKEMNEGIKEKYTEIKDIVSDKIKETYDKSKEKWENIKKNTAEITATIKKEAEDKYNKLKEALTNTMDKWRQSSEEKWSKIKEKTSNLVSKIKSETEDKYNKFKETLTTTMENWRKSSEEKWTKIKDRTTTLAENLKSTVEDKYNKFKTNLTTTLENLRNTSEEKWNNIKEKTTSLVENLRTTVENKYNTLKTNLGNKLNEIKSNAQTKWEEVKTTTVNKVSEVVNNATTKYGEMKSNFTKKMDEVKSALGPKWEELKTNAKSGTEGMVKKAGEGLSGLSKTLTDAIDKAKTAASNAWDKLKNVFSGGSFNMPKLPKLEVVWETIPESNWFPEMKVPKLSWNARGGIIDGITPLGFANGALQMGGEAGKEMVVPLENTSFTTKIAQAMGQAVDNALARSNNNSYGSTYNTVDDKRDIVLKVNERELARASINSINKLQRESGRTLLDI